MNCFRPKLGWLLMVLLVRTKNFTSQIHKQKTQIKFREVLKSLLLNIINVSFIEERLYNSTDPILLSFTYNNLKISFHKVLF